MKIIAVYDNGGKTHDRYTIVFSGFDKNSFGMKYRTCLDLSSNPESPQGFSQFDDLYKMGRHLGKKLQFEELPENVQKHVLGRIA